MFRPYVSLCLFALFFSVSALAADFPPGPMQEKVKASCTSCHAAAQVTKQRKTKAEWSKVLDKMVGYGAEVSDADRPAILKYLATNFGPAKSGGAAKSVKSEQGSTK
jgi:hypothetical protein